MDASPAEHRWQLDDVIVISEPSGRRFVNLWDRVDGLKSKSRYHGCPECRYSLSLSEAVRILSEIMQKTD